MVDVATVTPGNLDDARGLDLTEKYQPKVEHIDGRRRAFRLDGCAGRYDSGGSERQLQTPAIQCGCYNLLP
jgi:hypothetical protein